MCGQSEVNSQSSPVVEKKQRWAAQWFQNGTWYSTSLGGAKFDDHSDELYFNSRRSAQRAIQYLKKLDSNHAFGNHKYRTVAL